MSPGLARWLGALILTAMTATVAAAQDSPCVSEPAYTLDADTPGLVAPDSTRAEPSRGAGPILTETVEAGPGILTVVGRSCLSYVVEYRLTFDSVPDSPASALSSLVGVLADVAPYNRAPVPLGDIRELVRTRAHELLLGEWVTVSDNELGETIRIEYESGPTATEITLIYVVGL